MSLRRSIIEDRRAEIITRLTAMGRIDPACDTCRREIMPYERPDMAPTKPHPH